MPFQHPEALRSAVVDRVRGGELPTRVARVLGVSPTTALAWLRADAPELAATRAAPCCRCGPRPGLPPKQEAYAQLLGSYLGDGCLSRGARAWCLRVTCDDSWPGVADETAAVLLRCSWRSRRAAGRSRSDPPR